MDGNFDKDQLKNNLISSKSLSSNSDSSKYKTSFLKNLVKKKSFKQKDKVEVEVLDKLDFIVDIGGGNIFDESDEDNSDLDY